MIYSFVLIRWGLVAGGGQTSDSVASPVSETDLETIVCL